MGKHKKVILAVVVLLIVAGAAVYYFYQESQRPEEATQAVAEEPSAAKELQPEEKIEPIDVELDKSDEVVRKLAGELSSHPELARWLMSKDLIRRLVTAVDIIAIGASPQRQLDFIKLKGNFQVAQENGRDYIDPKSYQRYELIANIFVSLDTKGCVTLYKRLTPAIQEAYKDLGYPEADFNTALKRAFRELLSVPIVQEKIYLEKGLVTYMMVDPKLETLSPAQKHLLRMGPDNVRVIQAKLREMAQALGFQDLLDPI